MDGVVGFRCTDSEIEIIKIPLTWRAGRLSKDHRATQRCSRCPLQMLVLFFQITSGRRFRNCSSYHSFFADERVCEETWFPDLFFNFCLPWPSLISDFFAKMIFRTLSCPSKSQIGKWGVITISINSELTLLIVRSIPLYNQLDGRVRMGTRILGHDRDRSRERVRELRRHNSLDGRIYGPRNN